MTYKLFIDDKRYPPGYSKTGKFTGCDWVILRSSGAARHFVSQHGMPFFISFDHDLGMSPNGSEDTSMVFLSWLENELIEGRLTFPEDFDYYVHSQNPIGKQNIIGKMEALLNHFVRDAQFKEWR